jgi:uncharacterized Zn finger protein
MDEGRKKKQGKCVNCGGPTELLELDARKGEKILQCQKCGFLHQYKKDVFGWKFMRAARSEQS